MTSILTCSSSDKVTPLYPTCTLCTSSGHLWVTANTTNATLPRPDVGQCFLGDGADMPMTCPECLDTTKWKHIKQASECIDYRDPAVPSVFANPSTTCLQVRLCRSMFWTNLSCARSLTLGPVYVFEEHVLVSRRKHLRARLNPVLFSWCHHPQRLGFMHCQPDSEQVADLQVFGIASIT